MFIFGLIAQVFIFGGIGFLSPTLTLHLMTYPGFDEFWVGVYFAMPAVFYILNTFMVSYYCKWLSRKVVVLVGSSLFSLSIFLIGTSPLLRFPDNSHTMLVGAMLLGFSASMVTIPIFPEMLARLESDLPHLRGEELNN